MATEQIVGQMVTKYRLDAVTSQALQQIQKANSEITKSTGQVSKSFINLNKGTVQMSTSLGKFSNLSKEAGNSIGLMNGQLLQATLTFSTIAASVGLLNKKFVGMTYNFDRNMALVRAVSNSTQSEMEALSNVATDLGSQMEFGATRAAEALIVLSRMGLNAAESMQVLQPAMQLAQSQQYDLASSAEITIQQLRTFNKTIYEAESVTNTLAAVSAKSAADMDKLRQSLSYVGPVAAVAGHKFEEVNAALGLMYNAGIRASTAGTSLRFAYSRLMSDIPNVKKSIKSIGLSMEEINPSFNNMNDILLKFADALRNTQDRAAALFKIFGPRAAPGMAILIEQVIRNRFAFENMTDAITGTNEAARQSEAQMESFSGQALRLRSKIEGLGIEFGSTLVPMMQMGMDIAEGLVAQFMKLPKPIKEFSGALSVVVGSGAAFLATATMLVYSLRLLSTVFKPVAQSIQNISVGFKNAVPNMVAASKATQQFSMLLNTEIAQRALLVKGINNENRAVAEGVVQKALSSAATKKLAQEKMAEYIATIKQAGAEGILSKGLARRIVLSAQGIAASNGYTSATYVATTATNVFSGAIAKLGVMIKGLVAWITSAGGIFTLLIVGITLLVGAIAKYRAEQEKLKRIREENIETTKEFLKYAKQEEFLRNKLAEATNAEKKDVNSIKNLQDELNNVLRTSQKTRERLITQYPEIIDGYNKENGVLILNIKLLKGKLAQEEKLALANKIQSDDIKTRTQSWLDEAEAASSLKEKLSILGGAMDTLKFESKELKMEIAAAEKERTRLGGLEVSSGGLAVDVGSAIDAEIKKIGKLNEKLSDNAVAMNALSTRYQRLTDDSKNAGEATDRFNSSIDDAGSSAKSTGQSFESLFDKLENLKDSLDKMKRGMKLDIAAIDSDKLTQDLGKIEDEYIKTFADIGAKARDLDKILIAIGESKKLTVVEKERLVGMVDTLKEGMDEAKSVADTWNKEMTQEAKENYFDKMEQMHLDNVDKIVDIQYEINKIFDRSYRERLTAHDAAVKAELNQEKQKLNKLSAEYANLYSKMIAGQIDYGDKRLKIAEQQVNDQKNLINSMVKQYAIERNAISLEELENQFSHQEDFVEKTEKSELKLLKLKKDNLAKYIKYYETMIGRQGTEHERLMAEMQAADTAYYNTLINKVSQAGKQVIKLGGAIANLASSDDISAWVNNFSNALEGVVDLAAGIASEDPVRAIGGVIQTAVAIIGEEQRRKEEREAREEARQKKLEEASKATEKAFRNLSNETDNLRKSTIDLARGFISLNSSLESNQMLMNQTIADFRKTSTFGLENVLSQMLKNVRYTGETSKTESELAIRRQATEKLFSDPNLIAGIIDNLGFAVGKIDTDRVAVSGFTADDWEIINQALVNLPDDIRSAIKVFGEENLIRNLLGVAEGLSTGELKPDDVTSSIAKMTDAMIIESVNRISDAIKDIPEMIEDGVSLGEIGDKLEDIRELYESQAGKTAELSTGEKLSYVSASDYLDLMNRIFENLKETKGIEEAYAERDKMIEFALKNLKDLSYSQQLDLLGKLATVGEDKKKELEAEVNATMQNVKDSIDDVMELFEKGIIDSGTAMRKFDEIISTLPDDFKEQFKSAISDLRDDFKESISETVKARNEEIKGQLEKIEDVAKDYTEDLTAIDDKYQKIKETWEGLLEEREKLTQAFEQDKAKLLSDSEERINALEEEREAIIGTFDFSETQNVRSQRFAKAREVEKNILSEILKTSEAVSELTEKYERDIANVGDKIRELESVWGTFEGLMKNWQDEKNYREEQFIKLLEYESKVLDDMFRKLLDYKGEYKDFVEMFEEGTFWDTLSKAIENYTKAVGEFVQPGSEEYTPTAYDEKGRKVITEGPATAATGPTPITPVFGPIPAQHGFSGIVRKPTTFTAGEFNKPEMVSIKPLANMVNGLAGGSITNIYVNDHLDFRGAYGITNKKIAEQVYRSVWAPARRNNLNRYLNTRGRVIQ